MVAFLSFFLSNYRQSFLVSPTTTCIYFARCTNEKAKREYIIHGLGGTPRIRSGVSKVGKRGREKDRDAPICLEWTFRDGVVAVPFVHAPPFDTSISTHRPLLFPPSSPFLPVPVAWIHYTNYIDDTSMGHEIGGWPSSPVVSITKLFFFSDRPSFHRPILFFFFFIRKMIHRWNEFARIS